MWSPYGHPDDDYIAALSEEYHAEKFAITCHHGEMPAFDSKEFDTMDEAKAWAKEHLGITHWRAFNGQFTSVPVR